MSPEEFRRHGYRVIDMIADYRAHLGERPVRPPVQPGDVRARLPATPPATAESFESVDRDLAEIIIPGLTHWQHPAFFGYFPANSELSSVLGDTLSSGLGVIGLAWQSSPALTELEEVVTDWVRQMVGLSPAWSGVIQDTASSATLVALLCARERASGFALARGGLQDGGRRLAIYYSEQAHSSVEKAALLAGFGRENLRAIATDEQRALRPEALAAAIAADRAREIAPCAIVATTGTTTSTAFDPLEAIAALAREAGCWLHVDAAMAGAAMILPECRRLWQGVEAADSIVLNAHKWLGAVFDCSLYFVRDPAQLVRVMSTNPSYLQSGVDAQVRNLRDWGIPLGRRFRALKLWCLIREQGVEGLAARLRRDLANAQWFATEVRAAGAAGWRVLAPVPLQTVCVRHEPPGRDGAALDCHTLAWVEQINASGAAYLTPAQLDGRWMARVSIGGLQTERTHVEALWARMRAAVG
ncbi:MAG: aminotransferase class V-fold PLP-dependent enzyme [Verrucomicrobia bacterium]|nr:aminotransferase class V-fold PLP-dependent enzyme [Verrucomicrobiota bacterium]